MANFLETSAAAGDLNAQFELGKLYEDGDEATGVEPNEALSLKWYGIAAAAGDGEAAFRLGLHYESTFDELQGCACADSNSEGTKAVNWFTRAALTGHAEAAFALASLHVHGECGVAQSDAEAAKWYRAASELGNAESTFNLGTMHAQGSGGLAKDASAAVELWGKAVEQAKQQAKQGDNDTESDSDSGSDGESDPASGGRVVLPEACFMLGQAHERGVGGLEVDWGRAEALFAEALKGGFAPARQALERLRKARAADLPVTGGDTQPSGTTDPFPLGSRVALKHQRTGSAGAAMAELGDMHEEASPREGSSREGSDLSFGTVVGRLASTGRYAVRPDGASQGNDGNGDVMHLRLGDMRLL